LKNIGTYVNVVVSGVGGQLQTPPDDQENNTENAQRGKEGSGELVENAQIF